MIMEDTKIIDLLFQRSETALEALSEKYGRLLEHVAMNVLGNRSDAEECGNDALLGVWNSIPPNRPESLVAYVCRIARNQALKRYEYNTAAKRNSCYDTALEEIEECLAGEDSVEKEIESAALTETIESFIDALNQTDRIIFMRRYYFSDSYADIARITGLTEKNISVKLVRMRKLLKEYLREGGYIL